MRRRRPQGAAGCYRTFAQGSICSACGGPALPAHLPGVGPQRQRALLVLCGTCCPACSPQRRMPFAAHGEPQGVPAGAGARGGLADESAPAQFLPEGGAANERRRGAHRRPAVPHGGRSLAHGLVPRGRGVRTARPRQVHRVPLASPRSGSLFRLPRSVFRQLARTAAGGPKSALPPSSDRWSIAGWGSGSPPRACWRASPSTKSLT